MSPRAAFRFPCSGQYATATSASYSLGVGWNLIGLSVQPATPLRLSDLAAAVNSGGTPLIGAYRYTSAGWSGATVSGTLVFGEDFELVPCEGYFLRLSGPTTWSATGFPILSPLPLAIQSGWNLIALPSSGHELRAGDVVGETDAPDGSHRIVEIDRWVFGGYQGHIAGYPFNDFPLDSRQGCFVRATMPVTWMPAR